MTNEVQGPVRNPLGEQKTHGEQALRAYARDLPPEPERVTFFGHGGYIVKIGTDKTERSIYVQFNEHAGFTYSTSNPLLVEKMREMGFKEKVKA